MGVGAALARGLQIGSARRSRHGNLDPLISLAGSRIPRGGTNVKRGRSTPSQIRSKAADQMLAEKSMILMERRQDLEERKQAMVEEQERQAKLERYYTRTEGIQTRAGDRADVASDRAHAARLGTIGAGQQVVKQRRADVGRANKERFNEARWGLENKQARPVLDYFDNFGAADVRIEGITFQPDGEGIIVTYPGNKKVSFKNADEAFKGLLLPTHPDMPDYVKQAKEKRGEKRKETELGLKVSKEAREAGKGGVLTPKQLADYREKAIKQYQTDYGHPTRGGFKEDAPNRDQYITNYINSVTGQAAKPPVKGERKTGEEKGKPKIMRNKKTGEMFYQYPDGTKRSYTPPTETRGEVHRLPIIKPKKEPTEEKKTAIPERKEPTKQEGAITYKDAQGNTVRQTVDAKGNVVKTIIKKKKKRKKKKKK